MWYADALTECELNIKNYVNHFLDYLCTYLFFFLFLPGVVYSYFGFYKVNPTLLIINIELFNTLSYNVDKCKVKTK